MKQQQQQQSFFRCWSPLWMPEEHLSSLYRYINLPKLYKVVDQKEAVHTVSFFSPHFSWTYFILSTDSQIPLHFQSNDAIQAFPDCAFNSQSASFTIHTNINTSTIPPILILPYVLRFLVSPYIQLLLSWWLDAWESDDPLWPLLLWMFFYHKSNDWF